ncbi:MAG: hypothetical protein Q9208_002102 [Pyrenodesmia sp. 3 TL-2023]
METLSPTDFAKIVGDILYLCLGRVGKPALMVSPITGIDNPHSDPPVLGASDEEISPNPQLSVEEMKRMLRNAEQQLTGPSLNTSGAQVHGVHDDDLSPHSLPKLQNNVTSEYYLTVRHGVARVDSSRIVDSDERRLASQSLSRASSVLPKTAKAKGQEQSSGPEWFHMPRTKLTPDLKRDLQLLKMRSTLDPKRHYKKDNQKPLIPEYSQIGTILEGPSEYYSSRISKRDRKRSFVEEVLAAEEGSRRFANKYNEIQISKTSGRRGYYDQLKQKRSRKP